MSWSAMRARGADGALGTPLSDARGLRHHSTSSPCRSETRPAELCLCSLGRSGTIVWFYLGGNGKMRDDTECLVNLNLKFNLKSALCFEASPPNPSREVAGDTIVFRDTQIGSSAVYQCNASNEHGYLLANAFVSVLGKHLRKVNAPILEFSLWKFSICFLLCC